MLDLRATLDKLLELQVHGGSGVSVGTITEYAGVFPPDGWIICDGRTLSRTVYAELFNEIGTTWGAGDGSTTFNIPDLRNRFSVGTGDLYSLTNSGGSKDSVVPYHNHNVNSITTGNQSASHTHTRGTMNITGNCAPAHSSGICWYNVAGCSGAFYSNTSVSNCGKPTLGNGTFTGDHMLGFDASRNWTGSTSTQSASHNHTVPTHTTEYAGTSGNLTNANLPPYVAMNFIIFTGVFQTLAAQTTWTLLEDRIQNSQLNIAIPSVFDEPITIDDDIKIKINQNVTTGVDYELNNTINILGWNDLVTNSEISFKGILSRMSHGAAVVGTIMEYAGIFPPDGWIVCDGRALSRAMYEELFDAIGTTYGSGDGSTTFNIPDFRGRVAIGSSGNYGLGNSGGEAEHTLTTTEMPEHIHDRIVFVNNSGWTVGDNSGIGYTQVDPHTRRFTGSYDGPASTAASHWCTSSAGGGAAHNNMQPYLAVNYIIYTGVLQTVAAATTWTLLQDRIQNSQLHIPVVTNFQDIVHFNGKELWEVNYPVGSYYETSDPDFDPNVEWGGYWELETDMDKYNTLSLGEVAIGKWKNGKTIYRLVANPYNNTTLAASTTYYCSVPSVIDQLIRFDILTSGNGDANKEVNKYLIPGRYEKGNNRVSLECNTGYSIQSVHVILEYTKTSSDAFSNVIYRWHRKHPLHINLAYHGSWVDSGTNVNEYTVYKSNASYNIDNAWDTAKITFSGRTSLSIGIRSYAESNYDYVLVSELDNDYLASQTSSSSIGSAYSNTTYTKAHTRGNQSASTYTTVTFDNINPNQEHYFYIIYRKDGSTHTSDDRGYFYIID